MVSKDGELLVEKITDVSQIKETKEELIEIINANPYGPMFKTYLDNGEYRWKDSWKIKEDARHKLDMLNGLRVHPNPPQFVNWMPHPEDVARKRAEQAAKSHEAIYHTKAHAERAEAIWLDTERRIASGELKLTCYAAPAKRKSKSRLFNKDLRA